MLKILTLLGCFLITFTVSESQNLPCQHPLIYEVFSNDQFLYYQYDFHQHQSEPIQSPIPNEQLGGVPIWSPNGEYVAIATKPNTDELSFNLYVAARGGEYRYIASGSTWPSPKMLWSPDSSLLAVEADGAVYVTNPSGSIFELASLNSDFYIPFAWSPNSRYIQIVSRLNFIEEPFQIYDVIAHETTIVAPSINYLYYYPGGWSPDGNTIVFTTEKSYHTSAVWMYSVETDEIEEILPATSDTIDTFVSWMPDGRGFLLNSNRTFEGPTPSFQDISLHYFDISHRTFEPYLDRSVRSIVWLPDGENFIYYLHTLPYDTIYIHNWKTNTRVALTDNNDKINSQTNIKFTLSPDGRYVAFVAGIIGRKRDEVFAIDLQTHELMRITNNELSEYTLTWGPCE